MVPGIIVGIGGIVEHEDYTCHNDYIVAVVLQKFFHGINYANSYLHHKVYQ
jgi:hypothetical protein